MGSVVSPSQIVTHGALGQSADMLEVGSRYPDADLFIPQEIYRHSTEREYHFEPEPPIMFFLQHPDGCGISCKDAISFRYSRLVGRDDAMFVDRGPSVSIRILWPGYTPWSRQIPTKDFRSPPMPITRSKLAKYVAQAVRRFLDSKRDEAMDEAVDPIFNVADITVDQLELVGLQHVSISSWQAHLRLRSQVRMSEPLQPRTPQQCSSPMADWVRTRLDE